MFELTIQMNSYTCVCYVTATDGSSIRSRMNCCHRLIEPAAIALDAPSHCNPSKTVWSEYSLGLPAALTVSLRDGVQALNAV